MSRKKTHGNSRVLQGLKKTDSLSPYSPNAGFSKYNMIYEFNYSILGHNDVRMVMTSVSGHLLNLEFTSSYRGWRTCSPLALFDAPVQAFCPDNYKDIKRTLEKEIRGCNGEP